MVAGYPLRIPAIPWRIPASASGYPPGDTDWGLDVPFSQKFGRVSGYPKGYPRPEGGMSGWKGFLPAGELHVPRRLEGNPSSRSLAGRLKGGYPRIPARIPAAADGYPPAGADAWMAGKSSRISGCKSPISMIHNAKCKGTKFTSDNFHAQWHVKTYLDVELSETQDATEASKKKNEDIFLSNVFEKFQSLQHGKQNFMLGKINKLLNGTHATVVLKLWVILLDLVSASHTTAARTQSKPNQFTTHKWEP
ncbi:uncharacterized protein PGTG_13784 [Puccinia graminis f. sp. tritici CRL 75-36-700-3]|uniref:Uncharacterized protein n=1 Tax=Puccinia graminis f. sp. tritici (strain CRL 75-36-700-3 / race SCCL) TaxID=418459 RepID=E3KUN0_PUCGT|nr:uncharacterized protein PGTG_13784 [Puccinia graminis f. sp. tritici CRL 75-36-700-3]EFP87980.1 hypothetical protein PGTG_13784 [Puccinia graminis f. sp. tritici CRL 75-36-700-3]